MDDGGSHSAPATNLRTGLFALRRYKYPASCPSPVTAPYHDSGFISYTYPILTPEELVLRAARSGLKRPRAPIKPWLSTASNVLSVTLEKVNPDYSYGSSPAAH